MKEKDQVFYYYECGTHIRIRYIDKGFRSMSCRMNERE